MVAVIQLVITLIIDGLVNEGEQRKGHAKEQAHRQDRKASLIRLVIAWYYW
jgi:hypothetical protein